MRPVAVREPGSSSLLGSLTFESEAITVSQHIHLNRGTTRAAVAGVAVTPFATGVARRSVVAEERTPSAAGRSREFARGFLSGSRSIVRSDDIARPKKHFDHLCGRLGLSGINGRLMSRSSGSRQILVEPTGVGADRPRLHTIF